MVKYRADIDGLRALSVLAVILFHYGVSEASGGFVGVDVFFVISGYLITRLLADQIAGLGLSLMDFYNRRIRRILPALLLIILVTLVAGWFLLLPQDYADLGRSAAYSSVGLGNFYFNRNTGYFDRAAELRLLLHLSSLGVEEQFYVVWPTLLAFIFWAAGKRRSLIGPIIGAITVVAFIVSLRLVASDPKAAFYLPYNRILGLRMAAPINAGARRWLVWRCGSDFTSKGRQPTVVIEGTAGSALRRRVSSRSGRRTPVGVLSATAVHKRSSSLARGRARRDDPPPAIMPEGERQHQ